MNETQIDILIVDDSQSTRTMIKRILHMTDLPIRWIFEASDGAEALLQLESAPIGLVLADLNMPGMDGFELIRRMKKNPVWRTIPVFVISAQPDPEIADQLRRDGVAGYLPKPFTPETVRNMVGPVLDDKPSPVIAPQQTTELLNLTLAEALAEALMTMAFVGCELIADNESTALPPGSRLVRIDFRGPDTQGSMTLAASPEVGAAMAKNLDLTGGETGDDVLKELANVACGLLLRMHPGGGGGFRLEPPVLSTADQPDLAAALKSHDLVALKADGHLIAAQVTTDGAFFGMNV